MGLGWIHISPLLVPRHPFNPSIISTSTPPVCVNHLFYIMTNGIMEVIYTHNIGRDDLKNIFDHKFLTRFR